MKKAKRSEEPEFIKIPRYINATPAYKQQIDYENDLTYKNAQIQNAKNQSKWNKATFFVAFLTLVVSISALIIALIR